MTTCARCGGELGGAAKFCERCGLEVGGAPDQARRLEVSVTDVAMPFGSMVFFMVQWTIAAIPAALILGIFAFLLWRALRAFGMGA